jgi:hypothetical protein
MSYMDFMSGVLPASFACARPAAFATTASLQKMHSESDKREERI